MPQPTPAVMSADGQIVGGGERGGREEYEGSDEGKWEIREGKITF